MADQHRRIEARGIVGSGMLNDPERIEQLESERARRERGWRDAPKRRFGEVLRESPAPEPREDETRERESERDGGSDDDDDVPDGDAAQSSPPLPRVPPDPRAARLHAALRKVAPRG